MQRGMFKKQVKKHIDPKGFIIVTIITFMPIVFIFSAVTVAAVTQASRTIINQDLIKQAQLASISAMNYAKEQFELDKNYSGTAETTLYTTKLYEIKYEVDQIGYTNPTNTQQDIRGVGRVLQNW